MYKIWRIWLFILVLLIPLSSAAEFEPVDDFGWDTTPLPTVTLTPPPTPIVTATPRPSPSLPAVVSASPTPIPTNPSMYPRIPGLEDSSVFFMVLAIGSGILNIILLAAVIYLSSKKSAKTAIKVPTPPIEAKASKQEHVSRKDLLLKYVVNNRNHYSAEALEVLLEKKGYPKDWVLDAFKQAGIGIELHQDQKLAEKQPAKVEGEKHIGDEASLSSAVMRANEEQPEFQDSPFERIDALRSSISQRRGNKIFDHDVFRQKEL